MRAGSRAESPRRLGGHLARCELCRRDAAVAVSVEIQNRPEMTLCATCFVCMNARFRMRVIRRAS